MFGMTWQFKGTTYYVDKRVNRTRELTVYVLIWEGDQRKEELI